MKIRSSSSSRSQFLKPLRPSVTGIIRRAQLSLPSLATGGLRKQSDFEPLHDPTQEQWLKQEALTMARRGDYAKAIALFDQLIALDPTQAGNFNNRGLIFFQSGQLELALADYDQAIALDPCLSQAYNNRANCFAAMGSLEAAIVDYETALDLNPANIHARINLGITFRELDLYSAAVEAFDTALQFNCLLSVDEDLETRLAGHAYAERGRTHQLAGDWNWAIADYDQALQLMDGEINSSVSDRLRAQVQVWRQELLQLSAG
jgi:tetratricopeptide (TPR) repeat protein